MIGNAARLTSLLFVPGNQPKMFAKAVKFAPSAFVPDLEDSVPDAEKAAARQLVAKQLPALRQSGALVIPRVNDLMSGWLEQDLQAVVGPHIYGVSVGKIRTPEDVIIISQYLDSLELSAGLEVGATRLVLWIETALAVVHCYEICVSSPRIAAVAFGAEDFTLDMAIERGTDDSEVLVARQLLCIAARAANVQALDTPFFIFRDDAALLQNSLASKRMGFRGKFAIHPAQLATIEQVFSPSEQEIAEARRIVEAFEAAEREGKGATSLDGKVIDVPVVRRARALLAEAARLMTDKKNRSEGQSVELE